MATTAKADPAERAKADTLVSQIADALAKIPGVTQVTLVERQPALAIWGFDYDGLPSSMVWNVTGDL